MALGLTYPLTNKYQEYLVVVKAVGVYGWQLSCADCLEIWKPQPSGTLRVCRGLCRNCFNFFLTLRWKAGNEPADLQHGDSA
jgi:hypothetical protein